MPQSTLPRIGVIISTTRDTRFGDKPARWIAEAAAARGDAEVEIVDLRDYDLPHFNEAASSLWRPSENPDAVRWQRKVDELDAFIFVTAEYNRSIPGALKDALDYAYTEWNRKPAACVGYGMVGAARAVEHLRNICVELQMAPTRNGVHIQGADFLSVLQGRATLESLDHLKPNVAQMLDELQWWTRALKTAREAAPSSAAARAA